jgi:hypothetical protein
MKVIDLTSRLERKKYSVFTHTNVYQLATYPLSKGFIAFADSMGIGFLKRTRKGVRMTSNGRVRWYHTNATDLQSALTSVRSNYGISIPSQGWDKVKVKHYNLTDVEQLIELL